MKKIMNDPTQIVDEMLNGLAYAHDDIIERIEGFDIIHRLTDKSGKVGVVSGGGSGHEPSHAGFVGEGMLSAAVAGSVFTSPTPNQVLEGIKVADEGAGVLLVIKNYSGDVMNFEMAMEMAELEDIEVASVVVDDDIAVEDSTYTQGRRGVAGTVLVHKVVGYYAEQGKPLAEIKDLADKLIQNIHTVGVALSAATVPEVGKPGFVLDDDEIEYGVGIHSEPGYRREKIQTAAGLAKELTTKILDEFDNDRTVSYGILINGMGATPLMEQYVFTNEVGKLLADKGITVNFKKVGDYMTSLDMAGLSLTLVKFEDPEWLEALNAPVNTIAW